MTTSTCNLGPAHLPFPDARPSKLLQAEDAFMHAHGGAGPQVMLWLVDLFAHPLRIWPASDQTSAWPIQKQTQATRPQA